MKYTIAAVDFKSLHRRQGGGPLHAHTWRIQVTWLYKGACAEGMRTQLVDALTPYAQRLPDELGRAEELAEHLGQLLNACRVDIWREAEQLGAAWIA